jgi:hypothetical protein
VLISADPDDPLAVFFLLVLATLLVAGDETFLLFGTAGLEDFCFFLEVSFFVDDCLLGDSLSTKNKPMGK